MKKHLILISLFVTTAFPALFGQTLQVGMRWEYLSFPFFVINPNEPPVDTATLEIVGDTLIQGKEYFQLATNTYPCNYEPTTLIREEGSRVYHHYEGEDYLLYDYSLNPGDTLWQAFWHNNNYNGDYDLTPYPLYITDTMSVLLGGEWRKVQYISYNLSTDTLTIYNDIGGLFIEGLGSAYFLYPISTLCEFANCLRAIYWPNGDSTLVDSLTNCLLIDNTTERAATQALSVSPNPVQDVLYLHPSQPLSPDSQVRVYDLYGREVYRGAFEAAEKGISTGAWPAGVYVAEIWDGKKRQIARVVVK
jgi:hypothetical protein